MAAVSLICKTLLSIAEVSETCKRSLKRFAVSVIKIRLEAGIFLSDPFKVVTMESVGKPVPVKFICEIGFGSHVWVVALNTSASPPLGRVPETFLPINCDAFHIAAVLRAMILVVSPFWVTVIPVESVPIALALIVRSPETPFNLVTPADEL